MNDTPQSQQPSPEPRRYSHPAFAQAAQYKPQPRSPGVLGRIALNIHIVLITLTLLLPGILQSFHPMAGLAALGMLILIVDPIGAIVALVLGIIALRRNSRPRAATFAISISCVGLSSVLGPMLVSELGPMLVSGL